ncbi:hypothetical protein [Paraburkholderia hospita]|uniref:hypothetical protein n=1 Tax=Paraburkholderia hospita TaxID=169430 RepID=UPI000B344160|nr:hypothetical protein [Paraburkholderia hospita]OUL85047.1 hypothetical protein CA603_24020 [Paraburkholderia hospita]
MTFSLSIASGLFRRDWTVDDVWTMLACLAEPASMPFPSPLSSSTVTRLSDIYRAGNGGVCGVVMGESGTRAACGSRFGCVFCGMVSNDKSLENMMQEQEYVHLKRKRSIFDVWQ